MEDIWVKICDRDGPLGHKRPASTLLFVFLRGTSLFTATLRTRKEFLSCQGLSCPGDSTIGALRAERQILTSVNGTSCSARYELRSCVFFLIVLRSARYLQVPRFLQFLREFWPMPPPPSNHSAFTLLAQRTRITTFARSIGFYVFWVCNTSSCLMPTSKTLT